MAPRLLRRPQLALDLQQCWLPAQPATRFVHISPGRIHSRIHSQSFSCASDHFKHDNEANAAPHLFHFGLNCRHLSEELLWMLCFQQPQSLKMTELTLEISDIATACCILMCTSLCRLSLNLVNLLADGGSARVEGLLLVCRSHFIGCQSAAVRSTCCAMRVRCDMCDLCQRRPSDDMKVRSGRTRQSTAKKLQVSDSVAELSSCDRTKPQHLEDT